VSTLSVRSDASLLAGTSLIPFRVVDEGILYRVSAAPAAVGVLRCERCGAELRRNGARRLKVMDLPVHGRSVKIEIEAPRFVCPFCGRSGDVRPADLHPTRQMTARLVAYIEQAGLQRPYADIAREIGVGQATIAKICNAQIEPPDAYRPMAPAVLCIDEAHMRKGEDYAVLSDHDAALPIEMLPNVDKESLIEALRKLRNPERCHTVVIDMTSRYFDAIREALPHAFIVADPFHVLKQVLDCLRQVASTQHRYLPEPRPKLMKLKSLLISRPAKLSKDDRKQLKKAFAGSSYLWQTYKWKERIIGLYSASSHGDAAMHLEWWIASLPRPMACAFKEALTAYKNWAPEILAYWLAPQRATNGPAEGMNSVIKRISREGGGDLSFKLLRARVLHGEPLRRAREARRQAVTRTRRRAATVR